jgi:hypothetical protein
MTLAHSEDALPATRDWRTHDEDTKRRKRYGAAS